MKETRGPSGKTSEGLAIHEAADSGTRGFAPGVVHLHSRARQPWTGECACAACLYMRARVWCGVAQNVSCDGHQIKKGAC